MRPSLSSIWKVQAAIRVKQGHRLMGTHSRRDAPHWRDGPGRPDLSMERERAWRRLALPYPECQRPRREYERTQCIRPTDRAHAPAGGKSRAGRAADRTCVHPHSGFFFIVPPWRDTGEP